MTDNTSEILERAVAAAIKALWRPIETAPMDGTAIYTVVSHYQPCVCQWVEFEGRGRWSIDPETFMDEEHFREYFVGTSYEPTHWMPLPPTPVP